MQIVTYSGEMADYQHDSRYEQQLRRYGSELSIVYSAVHADTPKKTKNDSGDANENQLSSMGKVKNSSDFLWRACSK